MLISLWQSRQTVCAHLMNDISFAIHEGIIIITPKSMKKPSIGSKKRTALRIISLNRFIRRLSGGTWGKYLYWTNSRIRPATISMMHGGCSGRLTNNRLYVIIWMVCMFHWHCWRTISRRRNNCCPVRMICIWSIRFIPIIIIAGCKNCTIRKKIFVKPMNLRRKQICLTIRCGM